MQPHCDRVTSLDMSLADLLQSMLHKLMKHPKGGMECDGQITHSAD